MSDYTKLDKCRVCENVDLTLILDLNEQPLANSYHSGEDLPTFPLELVLCEECFHLQLSVVVNPDLMFKDYLYVSGTTKTLRDYFDDFAERFPKVDGGKVLDIACNDGSQLDAFKKRGWITYGVDPAENLFSTATEKGHNIICDYWTDEVALKLDTTFNIITAQNVFAHTHDIFGFLQSCKKVMDKNSKLFIQTSQATMIANNEFDTIYHEHLSFFSTISMIAIVERCGLKLEDVFIAPIHGNSYVFQIGFDKSKDSVKSKLESEKSIGLYDIETYKKYAAKCSSITRDLKDIIESYKDKGYIVVGYGAAAKGNTLLNFGEIDLDYIVDDNPLKHNLLTPGRDIPIYNPSVLVSESDNLVIIPLAWNFYKEIKQRVEAKRPNKANIFVKYFPDLTIEKV